MPDIDNIPIPQQVKDKMQNLGIAEEEINKETVVLYSLFNQAIKRKRICNNADPKNVQ